MPLPSEVVLRAGSLSVRLVGGELRHLRAHGQEVVRRLAVVVRDGAWGTIDPALETLDVLQGDDGFEVRIAARCARDDLDVSWTAILRGAADGTLDCRVALTPHTAFAFNRMGFVLLHPLRETTGRGFRAATPGGEVAGAFPELVGPQPLVDGTLQPLFPSFDALELDARDGVTARFAFEGDLFETEDQRNWSDGSFKTYSTPLALGFPHRATPGATFEQRVRLAIDGPDADDRAGGDRDDEVVRVAVGAVAGRVPAIGAVVPEGDAARLADAAAAVSAAYVRADSLAALRAAADAGLAVELAVTAADAPQAATLGARVVRVIALAPDRLAAPAWDVATVREAFAGTGVPVCGGADSHLAEVNRTPPGAGTFDALAFPVTPQVHLFDEDTLREALEALPSVARTGLALAHGKDVHISPLTLRPRRGPGSEPRDGAPAGTDPRQATPLAGAWTLAAIAGLAAGGAASVTAHELWGTRGVVGDDGARTPAGDAMALLAPLAGAPLRATSVSAPLRVAALAADGPDGAVLLLANLTDAPVAVDADGRRLTLDPYALIRHPR